MGVGVGRQCSDSTLISSFIVSDQDFTMFAKILNPKAKQGLRGAGGLPGWGKGGMALEAGTEFP